MLFDGPVGAGEGKGPDESDGDGDDTGLLAEVLPFLVLSTAGRFGGAAPQSGLVCRSVPKDPRPPLPMNPPRGGGATYPRGPDGGATGPVFSDRL